MLTTITTTTTTTVVALTQAATLGAIGVVILITLLIAKELLNSYEGGRRAKFLARSVNAAIYPLLFAFATIVLVKVLQVL